MKTNIQCLISSVVSAGILLGLVGNARAQSVTTTTTLTSSANRSVFGQPVVFTALVNPTNAPGTVHFNLTPPPPQAPSSISVTVTNGMATWTTNGLSFGTNQITAFYSGGTGFNTSESSNVTQLVTLLQNLFASTFSGGQIIEYTMNDGQIVFASALDYPSGLVFDVECNLYEADQGDGKIYEFTNPLTAGETKITFASGLNEPTGLAFDAAGDLFEADYESHNILELTNGYESGETPLIFAGIPGPADGLAFDRKGNLFVSDFSGNGIYEYTNGYRMGDTPVTFALGLNYPVNLAFDSKGNLFMTEPYANSIYEFTNPLTTGEAPVIFATNLDEPSGLTFDAMGNLFVADGSGNIYAFTTNGIRTTFATGLSATAGQRIVAFLAFEPVPEVQGAAANGVFHLTVTMPSPYRPTILQASTDLINWSDIDTNTPPFTFTDLMTAGAPSRFYRALLRR